MKTVMALVSMLLLAFASFTIGFTPTTTTTSTFVSRSSTRPVVVTSKTQVNMALLGGEKDRDKLTRESEPEDFFRTNTDKMTDEEKIPLALIGVAFITLPFIAGLIALYAAK